MCPDCFSAIFMVELFRIRCLATTFAFAMDMMSFAKRIFVTAVAAFVLWSCSSVRHVPAGSLLLDDVRIEVVDSSDVKTSELVNYLRQTPNHKVLGFAKLQLATYNMSGKDSTR